MTLHKTQLGALAEPQTRPIGNEPVIVKHAAFAISPASFDEISRLLRARMYHHVFDPNNGAIYMDSIALTRGDTQPGVQFCSSYLLENNKPGDEHRYLGIDAHGAPRPVVKPDDAIRFARDQDAETFAKLITNMAPACSPTIWAPVPHLWG